MALISIDSLVLYLIFWVSFWERRISSYPFVIVILIAIKSYSNSINGIYFTKIFASS